MPQRGLLHCARFMHGQCGNIDKDRSVCGECDEIIVPETEQEAPSSPALISPQRAVVVVRAPVRTSLGIAARSESPAIGKPPSGPGRSPSPTVSAEGLAEDGAVDSTLPLFKWEDQYREEVFPELSSLAPWTETRTPPKVRSFVCAPCARSSLTVSLSRNFLDNTSRHFFLTRTAVTRKHK